MFNTVSFEFDGTGRGGETAPKSDHVDVAYLRGVDIKDAS